MSAHYSDEDPICLVCNGLGENRPGGRCEACDGSGIELARTVAFDWEPDPLLREVVRPYPPRTDRDDD